MLPIYSKGGGVLNTSKAGLEPCFIITESDLASPCISVYLMKLREVLPFWKSWWQSSMLSAPILTQWLARNLQSSLKELWASNSKVCYTKIPFRSHTHTLLSCGPQ